MRKTFSVIWTSRGEQGKSYGLSQKEMDCLEQCFPLYPVIDFKLYILEHILFHCNADNRMSTKMRPNQRFKGVYFTFAL
ncbi:hypothetical protein RRG08_009183 [Elysia crispata]|uniref:Uncharacterized protein n=1 Tax=Elysia crispata TaxID=231223 RepID=A0AAE1DJR5_9GAST|nr:hypothetical protein RRG08_009183 [Elysia crispata]